MTKVFSAIQPTGMLHLGNYLGALKQFVELQNQNNDCMYCIADLHAITLPQNPSQFKDNILFTIAAYLASGLDIDKSTIFVQSHVPEHSILNWILICNTPMGWLERMTQFKNKAKQNNILSGLYAYPCLMAADILLYQIDLVPIGEDQTQHLEFVCDIAQKLNYSFQTDFFCSPKTLISPNSKRIMSLRDATKKMSKSEESDYSRINLTDSADIIAKKICKAKTDSDIFPTSLMNAESRLEINNLINIYTAINNQNKENIIDQFSGKLLSIFKKALIDSLVEFVIPIRHKIQDLMSDKIYLQNIAENGAKKAQIIASQNINCIKQIIGLK